MTATRRLATRWLIVSSACIAAVMLIGMLAWPLLRPPANLPPVGPSLVSYVRALGYRPLAIPRDRWGPGTVIAFASGEERFIRFNQDCLDLRVPDVAAKAHPTADVDVAQVSLPSGFIEFVSSWCC